jgi:hypothetical protein
VTIRGLAISYRANAATAFPLVFFFFSTFTIWSVDSPGLSHISTRGRRRSPYHAGSADYPHLGIDRLLSLLGLSHRANLPLKTERQRKPHPTDE